MANERWIIIHMQHFHKLDSFVTYDLSDIAETDDNGYLLVFKSLDEAHGHQEENGISGQCISLPLYD
jgi:hypothetical protein